MWKCGDYVDAFGHKQLREQLLTLLTSLSRVQLQNKSCRTLLLQRSASHMASHCRYDEAFMVGGAAVKAADEGDTVNGCD